MDAPKKVSFLAAFPDLQSTFSMSGIGDGARLKIDIPRSDVEVVTLLHLYFTEKPLRITIEALDTEEKSNARTISRQPAKRRKQ